jgi:predicted ABC-type sugar transport system permease subunit
MSAIAAPAEPTVTYQAPVAGPAHVAIVGGAEGVAIVKEAKKRPTLKGGFGRVWGTVVGVVILGLIGNILNLQSFISPYLNGAFQGVIIILAVLLQRGRRTR